MKTSKYKQWGTVMILVLLGLAIAQPGQAQTRLHLPDLTPYQITFTYSGEYVRNAEQFVFTRLDPDSGRFDGVIRRFTHGKHEDTPVSGEISNVLNERVSTVEGQAYKIKFATPN